MTTLSIIIALIMTLAPADAFAMHIADGVLPNYQAAAWFAAAVPFVAFGLYRLGRACDCTSKTVIAMVAAAVFVISCLPIPVPFTGTDSHPAGTVLAAIVAGPVYGPLAAAVALILQALIFSHGGLTALGANVFSMGVIGSLTGWLIYRGLTRAGVSIGVAAFFAGTFGDWAIYTTTALQLAWGLGGAGGHLTVFNTVLLAFAPVQIPVGIFEGLITAGAVKFLHSRRPEIFYTAALRNRA